MENSDAKRKGRPPVPIDERRTVLLGMLTTAAERNELDDAAREAELATSTWARGILLAHARGGRPAPPVEDEEGERGISGLPPLDFTWKKGEP